MTEGICFCAKTNACRPTGLVVIWFNQANFEIFNKFAQSTPVHEWVIVLSMRI